QEKQPIKCSPRPLGWARMYQDPFHRRGLRNGSQNARPSFARCPVARLRILCLGWGRRLFATVFFALSVTAVLGATQKPGPQDSAQSDPQTRADRMEPGALRRA